MTLLAIVLAWVLLGATFGIVWRNTTNARYSRAGVILSGAVVGPIMFLVGLMALSCTMLKEREQHEPQPRHSPRRHS